VRRTPGAMIALEELRDAAVEQHLPLFHHFSFASWLLHRKANS
jgi:hypothetical protein